MAPTDAIREHFPALQRRVGGRRVAYFDGPGGTQVPAEVADAVRDHLLRHNANAGWSFPTSRETDAVLAAGRRAVADLLGARPGEVAFGANMTTLAFRVARALGRRMQPGDEVVVTELDHHASVAPWRALEEERGVVLRSVPFRPETGRLDWDALEEIVGERTRVLVLGLASNALGTVNDVRRAADLAADADARLFVDAVHAAPHRPIDVRAMGCDYLAFSVYKVYGPHVGALYGRGERLAELPVPAFEPAPESAPARVETGTLNYEGIAGTVAAVDFLASLAAHGDRRERVRATLGALERRGSELVDRLWQGLGRVEGVRRFGPPPGEPRTPTVAFSVEGVEPRAVASRLADRAVFVTHGDFYAPDVLRRLEVEGTGLVRAGCSCYTTREEVRRLVEGVAAIAGS